ncbi:phage tail protein [Streptococcus anginosus]|uniref:phage tail protein n=1 Tax=Streptococcus anginosus TaxID=1328 RepID=UPI0021F88307|nr:phage tail protein [Streptococcus anginosus]MCW1017094.1 phage tail protein [Streptococcus anginosus]MCW1023382.1 phage tail protein [Streptococcus anginosus]MCW1063481.1 phage tail protein [Streptococcus anginosus]
MAIVGLKMVTLALVDDNQKLIKGAEGLSESGIIEIDDKMWGSKTANITNLEGSVTKVPGNNKVQDVYTAPGAPQIAFDFNNLDFDVKQKVKGYKSDGKGGYVYQGFKPHVAVLIESQTLDRKHSVFFGFGDGIFQETTQNVGTDTDTAQTRQDDNMTYNALTTQAFGDETHKIYYSGTSNFSKENMLKEVFGGYTAAAGSESHLG